MVVIVKTILDDIIDYKRFEVESHKKQETLLKLKDKGIPKGSPFLSHFTTDNMFLIAEIKKASPSKGIIREDFNPIEIAKIYEKSGASALSVLTDEKYFQGHLNYLVDVHREVSLPLLRKEFIIDPYQIEEAHFAGASAILLIAGVLNLSEIKDFYQQAEELNLSSLVEVHNEEELEIALKANAKIIGINNRDLKTFKTDLKHTEKLLKYLDKDKIIISESGINHHEDIKYLQSIGVHGVLIGEAFMRHDDISSKVCEVMGF